MSSNTSPIVVGLLVEDRIKMTDIYRALESLGFHIIPTYTNNPMNKDKFPISSVKYVEDRIGFIGDLLSIEQINGYTYWIELNNIPQYPISVIPVDEVSFPQVMRNIGGTIPRVKVSSIALTKNLSKLYGDVEYIINPNTSQKELLDNLIEVLMEIKYNFK